MNKRQRKKAYKKKYGHNPPKADMKYHYKYWGKAVAVAIKDMTETARTLSLVIGEMLANINRTVEEIIECIKTMPEDDFDKLMENEELNAEIKALVWQIRRIKNE